MYCLARRPALFKLTYMKRVYNRNRGLCLLFFFLLFASLANAQHGLWTDVDESAIPADPADRLIVPSLYRTLRMDFGLMKNILATAPAEAEVIAGEPGLELSLPMPDGGTARFLVWNSPVMHPDLAAQFPEIQSFAGKGVDIPSAYVRFDISPQGFHAMVLRTGRGTVFIDPYAKGDAEHYIVYFRKNFVRRDGGKFECYVDEDPGISLPAEMQAGERAGDCGNLRTYRLALACTGEYANFHGSYGADKGPALAAMNTSMNRVNGVYEVDCGIRMVIIANNTSIIYTDPASDPYTNSNGSTMLGQNQSTCDNVIGTANYDIGHVFSTGGGGVAVLSSVCSSANKARGVTGSPSPVGDPFDIDYVAHEMGHQFGADHTQYNNCNRVAASAMEPGSASTIMGYAGICPPDVQEHSDDYFHARSLFQIGQFVTAGNGNSCDVPLPNGNSKPSVGNVIDKTIPISTPFVLTATATDPQNDPLSFCWEQMNAYTAPAQPMPPVSTNTTGPMFRSFVPDGSPSRYFPNFGDVLANVNPEWEELPSISRSMIFRVTVRDNHIAGGCTAEDDVTITTNASMGPFLVTSPNTNVTYPAGSVQTVTWSVANTTSAPVSCANVDILISTDGGQTFTTLIANTPNDGSQSVTMPNIASNSCRILIQCSNNYFYDVSNTDFQLQIFLPVTLQDFRATLKGNDVALDWSTASEKDNRGFQVEHSLQQGVDFQEIGWVDANNAETGIRHYSFTDRNVMPGATHYYRLKQVDHDGQTHVSDIRVVRTAGAGTVSVFPNPAGRAIRLTVPENAKTAPAQIRIWNAEGELEMDRPFEPGASVDIQALGDGVHRVEISAGGASWNTVFIKNGP